MADRNIIRGGGKQPPQSVERPPDATRTAEESPEAPMPHDHCPCGCGAHIGCFFAGDDEALPGPPPVSLTFSKLHEANRQRCARWHHGFPHGESDWSGADWSNAMQGEAGEAGNVVKKLRRIETNTVGSKDPPKAALLDKLGEELADTIIYADLLATFYGVDLAAHVVAKFNAVSIREDFPERL